MVALEVWLLMIGGHRAPDALEYDRGSRAWLVAVSLLAAAATFTIPFFVRLGRVEAAAILFWPGLLLIAAGVGLRFWAVRILGSAYTTKVVIQPDQCLVVTGPYRWVRHPAYTGWLTATLGVGLAQGHALSIAAALGVPLIGVSIRIRVEEAALRQRYGEEYAEYARTTSALVPTIWPRPRRV